MRRERPKRKHRLHFSRRAGALVFGLATAVAVLAPPGLAASSAPVATIEGATAPDTAAPAEESAFVARALSIDEQAAVTPRPGELRPAGEAHVLGASVPGSRADRDTLAIAARANGGPGAGGIARWCLAHATSTQAP
jgi:hypothetical protein